jgi:hypothetical protein
MARAATLANVSASATSVAVFPASGGVGGRSVYNDSAVNLYLKYGDTASTTSYTVKIPGGGLYEFPRPAYDGLVHGIWDSATGAARTTEVA